MIAIKIFWIILSLYCAYKFIRAYIMMINEYHNKLKFFKDGKLKFKVNKFEFFIAGFISLTFGLFLIVQMIEKVVK